MSDKIPAAIVLGSAIIAIGTYLGLRDRSPSTAAPAEDMTVARSAYEPAPDPSPRVREQASRQLEDLRAGFGERCWTPPGADEPSSISLRYDVTFGPQGELLVIGISDVRGAERPSVAACVRGQPHPLRVDPPGVPVRISLELTLP